MPQLSPVNVSTSAVMKHVTMDVRVTGTRIFEWRLRLGRWLIVLAGLVMGVGRVDIEFFGEDV